ncbi:MAG: division/cell wall cluster transcriptional repressor MraZ [Oligoflexia bacterium]|nr:division/cell wall cluster transcriptional repressor MraZ [Oligoflexia bacterium]
MVHEVDDSGAKGADLGAQCSSKPTAFRGNFTHAIDAKGRVNLPAEFRRILAESNEHAVVLTNYISDGSRCLEGFGAGAWAEFENKLRAKSRFSAKLQKLENFYLSRASECPIDGAGRILIPTYLREYASIEREVTFTSSIHGFRIWERRVWELIFKEAETALLTNPDTFSEVDL